MNEKKKLTLVELGMDAKKCVFATVPGWILGRNEKEICDMLKSFASTAIIDMHCKSICIFAVRYDGSFNFYAIMPDPDNDGKYATSENHIPATEFTANRLLGEFFRYTGLDAYGVLQETKPGYFAIISDETIQDKNVNTEDDKSDMNEWFLTNEFKPSSNTSHCIHWISDEFYILTMYEPDGDDCIGFWLGRSAYGKMEYIIGFPADGMSPEEAFEKHEDMFRDMSEMSNHIYELLEGEEIEPDGKGGFMVV